MIDNTSEMKKSTTQCLVREVSTFKVQPDKYSVENKKALSRGRHELQKKFSNVLGPMFTPWIIHQSFTLASMP